MNKQSTNFVAQKSDKTDNRTLRFKNPRLVLGQLNDIEILILKSHTLRRGRVEDDEFWKKHEKALTPPLAYLGSSQEEVDKYMIFKAYQNRLVDLGLLQIRFKRPKKGEFPELDEKTGMIKAQGHEITPLGRLLLRSIDQGGELN